MKITSIEPYNNSKGFFKIFVDGEYQLSLHRSIIEKFSLKEGGEIEISLLSSLDEAAQVRRARERIGEKGYDILHNNCEHFARYCYFGEKRCEVTEGVVSEWKSKTVCDVYFSRIPDAPEYDELFPKERNDEVSAVSNEAVKRAKYWAWKTLEYALFRSFGYKIRELDIKKTKSGKWVCK
jgi:hypothetical protein